MTAIDALLDGLIDYAGLFPPAGLGMATAVRNYLGYLTTHRSRSLGRFVIDANRLQELRLVAGCQISQIRLSVVASRQTDWDSMLRLIDDGGRIEALEIRVEKPQDVECVMRQLPAGLITYFEVPVEPASTAILDAICAAGTRAKIRMGGVVEDSFPSPRAVADTIQALSDRHLGFKATAGLHHPLRSHYPLTYAQDSPVAAMHGFINVLCAAALVYFSGPTEKAELVLSEVNRAAWRVSSTAIAWNSFRFSTEQIREMRREFFVSFGSCSFSEPIEGLEVLGWL
jgi:hypothetical protein